MPIVCVLAFFLSSVTWRFSLEEKSLRKFGVRLVRLVRRLWQGGVFKTRTVFFYAYGIPGDVLLVLSIVRLFHPNISRLVSSPK